MRFYSLFPMSLCVLMACLGCTEPMGAPAMSEPVTADGELVPVSLDVLPPGVYPQKIERADGTLLRYTISVPDGYTQAKPAPLVLSLHFGTGRRGGPVPEGYGRSMLEILVEPALRDLRAIILAPDSVAGRWSTSENEEALLQIMDRVVSTYNIDQDKVLVTGFSMGGSGTWHMAARHPDRFSAAIPIAARPPREDVEWKSPLYVIHSRDDQVAPFARTEAYVTQQQAQGVDIQLVRIDGVRHVETARFGQPLKEALPWVRKVWKEQDEASEVAEE